MSHNVTATFLGIRVTYNPSTNHVRNVRGIRATKKTFVHVANVIKSLESLSTTQRADVAEKIAQEFKIANPRFNHKRFMQACGVRVITK